MTFRQDINGLRAIAVLAVLLFHFQVTGFTGGFIGVDIFFVISGYLMTGIIFTKIDQQKFSLIDFYLHRARRIIPALVVVCVFLLIFSFLFLTYSDFRDVIKYIQKSIQFISNIAYYKDSGYFDTPSQYNWLLHTWSLSVEWQFYLLYPLLIILLFKVTNQTTIKYLFVFIAILSFISSAFYTPINATASFYLLPTRMWEMLTGGLVFLFPYHASKKIQIIIYYTGLIVILITLFKLNDAMYWPGYLALLPVLGTALIISASHNNAFITGNVISQFLGRISYSVYLWHWPIVVFLHSCNVLQNSYFVILGLGLSIILGTLSYYFIEKRITLKKSNTFELIKYLTLIIVLSLIAAGMGTLVKKYPSLRNNEVLEKDTGQWLNGQYGKCIFSDEFKHYQYRSLSQCVFGNKEKAPNIIVIGDSHSLIIDAVTTANTKGSSILKYYAGCPTLQNISFKNADRKRCTDFLDLTFKELETDYINVPLIIANRYPQYLEAPSTDYYHIIFNNQLSQNQTEYLAQYKKQYLKTLCNLTKKRPVYLLKPIPDMGVRVGSLLFMQQKFMPNAKDISVPLENYYIKNKFILSVMDQAQKQCGVKLLDPTPYLCSDGKNCLGSKDSKPLYMDDNHLNKRGNSYLIPLFKKEVFNE